jgi:hypothetical protein
LGQQIFMQFHQMFEQFESVQNQLVGAIDENNKTMTKSKWKRIDQIKEGRMLSVSWLHLVHLCFCSITFKVFNRFEYI